MTEDDVFVRTGDTYLRLIHPVWPNVSFEPALAPLLALAPSVPRNVVSRMIVGASWRERLLGLSLAMATCPAMFVEEMLDSLQDVRGISIVPTCAALAVLARRRVFDLARLVSGSFDRSVFDGEVGWAIDQAVHYAKGQPMSGHERGPNYGQHFAHQAQVYEWILNSQPIAVPDGDPAMPSGTPGATEGPQSAS